MMQVQKEAEEEEKEEEFKGKRYQRQVTKECKVNVLKEHYLPNQAEENFLDFDSMRPA